WSQFLTGNPCPRKPAPPQNLLPLKVFSGMPAACCVLCLEPARLSRRIVERVSEDPEPASYA
ncbi:MAG: hypothetical protein ACNA8S_15430, partial [Deferrisomatales bacterium]